jgi:branched-chain amino acid transport system substrate-binding protein
MTVGYPSWRRSVTALLAVGVLLVAACTEDSGDAASDVDPSEALGTENPAEGEPIQIGYVYDGTTDVIDASAELAAAEAAAQYVNDYLGGVAGRPIELDVCSTDQTPAGASDCVTQMTADEVPVVLNGVTGQAPVLFRPLADAGIPVFVTAAGDPSIMSAERVHILGNGIVALLGAPAQIAADNDVDRVAMATIDVPAASGALEGAAPAFFANVGIEVDLVLIPPDTPEVTPNIAAALESDPGEFVVIGDPAFCAKALDGIEAAGFDGQLVIIQQCMDDALRESATNLEGAALTTFATDDPDSEEFRLYQAVMDTYAEDGELGAQAPNGYQAVVGFARAMEGLTGEVNAETVESALSAMPPTPMPLADGITYQCDGQQVELATSMCSTDVLWTELDAEGNGTDYQVLEGAPFLSLG